MKKTKKIFSMLICIAMMVSLLPTISFAATYGDFEYETENDEVTITGYTGAGGAVVFPDTIEDKPVKHIGDYVFVEYNFDKITSVIIPEGVTSIGCYAFMFLDDNYEEFYSLLNLTSVTLPNSITYIGGGAFYECTSLKDIWYVGTANEWEDIEIEDQYDNYLNDATKHFLTVPALSTETDSGYYAESKDAEDKSGIVAFNSAISDFASYDEWSKSNLNKFGFCLGQNLLTDSDTTMTVEATNASELTTNGGAFYSTVTDVPLTATVYAKPFVVVGNDVVWGNVRSATVNAEKWLGAK